jgi:RNA polymerase sigma-70 factor (ECF subfamily)
LPAQTFSRPRFAVFEPKSVPIETGARFSVKIVTWPAMDERVESQAQPVGERISAEALFRAHARFVAGFVRRLGMAPEEIDDVVQDVFLTAHRRGGFETGPAKPTTWLAEIALRVVSTQRRTAKRRRTSSDETALDAAVSTGCSPLEAAEQRAALERVDRALLSLDVDRRAVFILFELEGEPCDAIAAGLGIPVGTVHSRLSAARKSFFESYTRIEKTMPDRQRPQLALVDRGQSPVARRPDDEAARRPVEIDAPSQSSVRAILCPSEVGNAASGTLVRQTARKGGRP